MVIYFCYGIHHSNEALLNRSTPDAEMDIFKPDHELEAMSPEKEAFLHNGTETLDDDE